MRIRTYAGLLVLMLVGLVAGTEYATNWIDIKPADSGGVAPAEGRMFWNTSSQQVNVYDANLQTVGLDGRLACDYLVYTNGTHYFAKNCSTGVVEKSGTNATAVIQYALDNGRAVGLSCGRFIVDTLFISDNTSFFGGGMCTIVSLRDWANSSVIRNRDFSVGNQNIIVRDMVIDGNNRNNAKVWSAHAVFFKRVNGVVLENLKVIDTIVWGIRVDTSSNIYINNIRLRSFGAFRDGIDLVDSNNAVLSNIRGVSGDDFISIKADYANVSNISVVNIVGTSDIANLIRINAPSSDGERHLISNVLISNVVGTQIGANTADSGCGLRIGWSGDPPADYERIYVSSYAVMGTTRCSGFLVGSGGGLSRIKDSMFELLIVNPDRHGVYIGNTSVMGTTFRVKVINVSSGYQGFRIESTSQISRSFLDIIVDYVDNGKILQHGVVISNTTQTFISAKVFGGDYGVVLRNTSYSVVEYSIVNSSGWGVVEENGSDYNIVRNNIIFNSNKYLKGGAHSFIEGYKYTSLPSDGVVLTGVPLWYYNGTDNFLVLWNGSSWVRTLLGGL